MNSLKSQAIWGLILGIGLISFSVYTIKHYSKSSHGGFAKVVVAILGIIFIIGGAQQAWVSGKVLAAS